MEIKQNPRELDRAISVLLSCVKREEKEVNREVLGHILFEVEDGVLHMVAADGFRMARVKFPNLDLSDGKWLLHRTDAQQMRSLLKTAQEVRLKIDNTRLTLGIIGEDTEKTVTLEAGSYPEWKKLFPTSFATEAIFTAKEMRGALRGGTEAEFITMTVMPKMILGETKGFEEGVIKFVTKREGIKEIHLGSLPVPGERPYELFARREESREEELGTVKAKVKGRAIKQSFNSLFLTQAARSLNGEVILRISGGAGPAVFNEIGAGIELLFMPLMEGSKPGGL